MTMEMPPSTIQRRRRTQSRRICANTLSTSMIVHLVALLEWVAMMSGRCRSVQGWVPCIASSSTLKQQIRWWSLSRPQQQQPILPQPRHSRSLEARKNSGSSGGDSGGGGGFLDVEFERVVKDEVPDGRSRGNVAKNAPIGPSEEGPSAKSWIEWSLEADPELNSTRIPFFDFRSASDENDGEQGGTDFIDVRLAFLVELDGETYGIGTSFDHAVALTVETTAKKRTTSAAGDDDSATSPLGSVQNLPPTPDNEELMEIMATQLHESVGNDLQLVRTPRVLTVRGPLETYTANWRNELLPEPLSANQLLDETDEDVDDFLSFMRRELGDQEVDKTLRGVGELSADDEELINLFNIPGLGDQVDDGEGIKDLLESLMEAPQKQNEQFQKLDPSRRSAAIKLFSYIMPGSGKVYSLVSLLQPYVLVAKRVYVPSSGGGEDRDTNESGSVRFELLASGEEKLLIPRLEQVCKADLERAGLQLRAAAQEPTSELEP